LLPDHEMMGFLPRRDVLVGLGCGLVSRGKDGGDPDQRFTTLLGRSPTAPVPIGKYSPTLRVENLLYVSTTVARRNGEPLFRGLVGHDLPLAEAVQAARITALAVLEAVFADLGSLTRVRQIVNLTGYIASADGFVDQSVVMDGASEVMLQIFGSKRGLSSRSAIGVKALSRNAAVAISGVFQVS
jgi:NAD(P)H dehydrogenase (quinone)